MLEAPVLDTDALRTDLQRDFGIRVTTLEFLPIGADGNAAVYRAMDDSGAPYFVKLRRGAFDEISVLLPAYLRSQDIKQIIAPLPTLAGQLFARQDDFTTILYPFVAGRDGYAVDLSPQQWAEFGTALRQLHTTRVPPALRNRIPRERFSARWRDGARSPPVERLQSLLRSSLRVFVAYYGMIEVIIATVQGHHAL